MKLIYLAHAISDPRGFYFQERNNRQAEEIALELWRMGFACHFPGGNTRYFHGALPYHDWIKGDLCILSRCDGLVLAPNWLGSAGANGEYQFALAEHIPVFEWPKDFQKLLEFRDAPEDEGDDILHFPQEMESPLKVKAKKVLITQEWSEDAGHSIRMETDPT